MFFFKGPDLPRTERLVFATFYTHLRKLNSKITQFMALLTFIYTLVEGKSGQLVGRIALSLCFQGMDIMFT